MYNLRKAPMFPILTDPDILLHMSCTPAGDKGSKLSLQPALMDKFIPLKGQTLYEAVVLQTLQKCWLHLLEKIWVTHTHIHKKGKKKKRKRIFLSFHPFKRGGIFTIKKEQKDTLLSMWYSKTSAVSWGLMEKEKRSSWKIKLPENPY